MSSSSENSFDHPVGLVNMSYNSLMTKYYGGVPDYSRPTYAQVASRKSQSSSPTFRPILASTPEKMETLPFPSLAILPSPILPSSPSPITRPFPSPIIDDAGFSIRPSPPRIIVKRVRRRLFHDDKDSERSLEVKKACQGTELKRHEDSLTQFVQEENESMELSHPRSSHQNGRPLIQVMHGEEESMELSHPRSSQPIEGGALTQDVVQEEPRGAVLPSRIQYGCGSLAQVFKKKSHFPTEEEKRFFAANVYMSNGLEFRRENAGLLSTVPQRIRFADLEKKRPSSALHLHCSNLLDIFIREVIEQGVGDLESTPFWFSLSHPGYKEGSFHAMHRTYKSVDGGVIMNMVARHMQSNTSIALDEVFTVEMNLFIGKNPREKARHERKMLGRGPSIRNPETIRSELMDVNFGIKHQRVLGDGSCMAKAIGLGKLESDMKKDGVPAVEMAQMKKNFGGMTRSQISHSHREKQQLKLAKTILEDAGMNPDVKDHDRDDLKKLAEYYHDYQIILWGIEGHDKVAVEIERFNPDGTGFIGLFFYRGHYEFVSHTVGPRASRFCYKCYTFDGTNHHRRCAVRCRRCGNVDCQSGKTTKIICADCHILFRTQECYIAHQKPVTGHSLSFCEKYFYCQGCLTIDRTDKFRHAPHICGTKEFCFTCRSKVPPFHECIYRLPSKKSKAQKVLKQSKFTVLAYDIESIVVDSGEYDEFCVQGPKHTPNMIGCQLFCEKCVDKDDCDECGPAWTYSYMDDDNEDDVESSSDSEEDDEDADIEKLFRVKPKKTPIARFCNFLLTNTKVNKAYIIAHNGGRYDHRMVLDECDRQSGLRSEEPRLVLKGMTIISADFKYKKQILYFRDSIQFLPMALAKMPEAFGLTGEAKGFFPYLYNHPDNYNKILTTLPPKEYYNPEFMSSAKREEFDEWYEESYDDGFELFPVTLKYCLSDVRILTLTLKAFIRMSCELFDGWNPIIQGCTLASYIMFVLQHMYIKAGDVGFVPETGYGCDNNSILAIKYIQWMEKEDPTLHFEYCLRNGEHKIRSNGRYYKVDAYNPSTNEVFEVYGCLWHGCPKCQPIREKKNVICDQTPQELYDRTKRREDDIISAGYTLHVIWECEIHELLSKNRDMKKFFALNKYTRRLNPRDGVFGGRTQAFRAITEATDDVDISFYDFVSMYPFLNSGGTAYPRGNPQVLTDNFPPVNQPLTLRGIIFCDVLPPIDAKMGYLPQRFHKKLMFTLCRLCAENQNTEGPCTHLNVSERYITGVWTTDELNKAVSRGYRILKFIEIWHWKDADWVRGGFFADYIKPLLKLKHESSGWPKENMSDDEKKAYVENILRNDGVQLDIDKIIKNKGLRSLIKILLNAAWGKFAQNPIRTETRLIPKSDIKTLTNFFNDPNYIPNGMIKYGKRKLFISRISKRESALGAPFSNLPIGIITCSAGRLRLTEGIERVGVENMVYCDTDSLIFTQKKNEDPLGDLKGDQLGFLVNEIPEGKAIKKVVVMAPKTYGLKICDDETDTKSHTIKTKGLTMTSENARKITFEDMEETMKEFIEFGVVEPLEGEMLTFKRGDTAFDGLWSCKMKKHINPRMDKGHFVDGVAIPYGQLPTGTILNDDYPFY